MSDGQKPTPPQKTTVLPGIAILGLIVVGIGGIIHACLVRSGLGLIASAIAFGVVAHVSFK